MYHPTRHKVRRLCREWRTSSLSDRARGGAGPPRSLAIIMTRLSLRVRLFVELALAIALDTAIQFFWKTAADRIPADVSMLATARVVLDHPIFLLLAVLMVAQFINWLKVLELAGVLTWAHRIARIQVRERDLFGKWASRWRVIRTSNAYVFRDPQQPLAGVPASKSENPTGTQNLEILVPVPAPARDPESPLERALARFGAAIEGRLLANGSGGTVEAI